MQQTEAGGFVLEGKIVNVYVFPTNSFDGRWSVIVRPSNHVELHDKDCVRLGAFSNQEDAKWAGISTERFINKLCGVTEKDHE